MTIGTWRSSAPYVVRDGLGAPASGSPTVVPTSKLSVFETVVLVRLAPGQREKHRSSGLRHRVISRGKRDRIGVLDAREISHSGLHFQIGGQPLRAEGEIREACPRQRGPSQGLPRPHASGARGKRKPVGKQGYRAAEISNLARRVGQRVT